LPSASRKGAGSQTSRSRTRSRIHKSDNVAAGWQLTVNNPPNFLQTYGASSASPSASQGVVAAGGAAQVMLTPFNDSYTGNGVCSAEGNTPFRTPSP
jgi:hypothetical protein